MGKYLAKKVEIESAFKVKADSLLNALRSEVEDAEEYNTDQRALRLQSATDKYEAAMGRARSLAIDLEASMFEEARAELEAVLTKTPSASQMGYLQAFKMLDNPTKDDLMKAAGVAKGNAIAERVVYDACPDSVRITAEIPEPVNLKALRSAIDAFENRRAERITHYGETDGKGNLQGEFDDLFVPSATCEALDELDAVIERYA